jgi:hypothetical protein
MGKCEDCGVTEIKLGVDGICPIGNKTICYDCWIKNNKDICYKK